jgi:hypothetical protein
MPAGSGGSGFPATRGGSFPGEIPGPPVGEPVQTANGGESCAVLSKLQRYNHIILGGLMRNALQHAGYVLVLISCSCGGWVAGTLFYKRWGMAFPSRIDCRWIVCLPIHPESASSTYSSGCPRVGENPHLAGTGSILGSLFTVLIALLLFPTHTAAQSSANFPPTCAPLLNDTCASFQGTAWRYTPLICNTEPPTATEEEAANHLYNSFYRPTNCSTSVNPSGPWLSGGPYSIPGCGTLANYSSLPHYSPSTGIELLNYRPYLVSYVASLPACEFSTTETHYISKSRSQACPPGMVSAIYGTNYVNGVTYSAMYCRGNNELKDLGRCSGKDVGNPINAATGNKFQSELDYRAAAPHPLEFERFYNSGGKRHLQANNFGPEWFSHIG